jgi:LysM repeat protein
MNRFLKQLAVLLFLALISWKANAQKFTSHAVKAGETLESIAKQYKVSPYSILNYNKEIKSGQALTPNTILVIPSPSAQANRVPPTVNPVPAPIANEAQLGQEEPIGFTSHRVRRKETLFGISQRYKITEEDIKKYNRELYSAQLKKGTVLRIPKYRRVDPRDLPENNPDDFETYRVAPKETRWSIANKYGITIDSLLALNPELSKTSDYLKEGQELKLPKIAGSTIEGQETQLYLSYTVPPKMNFYQLEKKFGVKGEEIVRLNPEITQRGGLQEGMVLRIPERKRDAGEINTENYLFYVVKPKQTEFSLTRKFGLSWKELLELNPDLKMGLKAGMVLRLPKAQTGNFEVRNALVLDKFDLVDSINRENKPKILVLLPFRLDKLNFGDLASVESTIEQRNDVKASLGLYSGALIALDSVADLGISVEVKTLDNQLDLLMTKSILAKENLGEYQAIFGPLDNPSLKEVAIRASTARVPVIAPIPVLSDISLPNVFFSYTSDEVLRQRMLSYMDSLVTDQNIIVIADSKNNAVKQTIMEHFPTARSLKLIEEEKNIGIDLQKLTALLSAEKENWVFLETDNFKVVSSVSSILNSAINEDQKVRLFTTNRNKAFENEVISVSHLSNLHFTFPSVQREIGNNAFAIRYQKRFGSLPDRFAVRGFDLFYDLLLKLAYKNDLFLISTMIGETEYNGNKFNYEKDMASGFFNQSSFIIFYEDLQIKEIKI